MRQEEVLRLSVEIGRLIEMRVRQNPTLKGDKIPRKAIEEIKGLLVQEWIRDVYRWGVE
jgi:hypothetical protein